MVCEVHPPNVSRIQGYVGTLELVVTETVRWRGPKKLLRLPVRVEGPFEAEDSYVFAEPICPIFSFSNSVPCKPGENSWSRSFVRGFCQGVVALNT